MLVHALTPQRFGCSRLKGNIMTEKERFIAALTFRPVDKYPLNPGGGRESTIARWRTEGLPEEFAGNPNGYIIHELLGIPSEPAGEWSGFYADTRMIPWFEEKVLKHENGHYIVRDWMGAVTEISDKYDYTYIRNAKDFVTRKWHSFPVKNREDWLQMRTRYDPRDPSRLPANLAEVGKIAARSSIPTYLNVNGPFWQMREWMGMENLCMTFIDDPDLVEEMCSFWGDFIADMLEQILPLVPITSFRFSEDMAYKVHSMISPAMTRQFLLPVYKKWISICRRYSVPVIDVDSDGYIAELIPIWIEAGVNACDPMEVAAGNDIVAYRREFGYKMAFVGGIDKRAIAAGGDTMKRELYRVIPPLLEKGGFIPTCDHGVPPDISFPNYIEYTRLLAELTGWL